MKKSFRIFSVYSYLIATVKIEPTIYMIPLNPGREYGILTAILFLSKEKTRPLCA